MGGGGIGEWRADPAMHPQEGLQGELLQGFPTTSITGLLLLQLASAFYCCVLFQYRGVHDVCFEQRGGFASVRSFQRARVSSRHHEQRLHPSHMSLTSRTRRFTQQADAFPVMRNLHSRGEDEDAVLYDGD